MIAPTVLINGKIILKSMKFLKYPQAEDDHFTSTQTAVLLAN